ncbi:MAG: GNAT family N-acetyltransferase [Clostridia bacterium]|nr:GNAT family N-acetyltransferase [Clostridia bacterium]
MTLDDYDAIYALWLACPEIELNDVDDTREGVERFLRRNPDTVWVAELDGRIAGVLMAGTDGLRGYIYHACVQRDHRGRGIGTALVDTALAKLRSLGLSKIGILVFADNADGLCFWQKHGFFQRDDLAYCSCVLSDVRRIG